MIISCYSYDSKQKLQPNLSFKMKASTKFLPLPSLLIRLLLHLPPGLYYLQQIWQLMQREPKKVSLINHRLKFFRYIQFLLFQVFSWKNNFDINTCNIGVALAKNNDIELQVFIGMDSNSDDGSSLEFWFWLFLKRWVVRR